MSEITRIQTGVSAIRSRLREVREHGRKVAAGEWVSLVIAAVVPVLAVLFVMDNLVHLPVAVRVVAWLGLAGGVVYLCRGAVRAMREAASDEEVALRVERAYPELNNELINSLLLSREMDEEAEELVASVVESGKFHSAKVSLLKAVPKKRLRALSAAACGALVVMALYAGLYPQHFGNALTRVLVPLLPVEPITLTKILAVKPENCNVLSGQSVNVDVTVGGRIQPAEIAYKWEGSEWKVARMQKGKQADGTAAFVTRLPQLVKDTVYYVRAGDAKTKTFTVTVHERPALKSVDVRLVHPEYSGLGSTRQKRLGIKALAGTRVEITAVSSKPLKAAARTVAGREPQPMHISPDGTTISTQFTLIEDESYTLDLVDVFGFENEEVVYDAEVLIDHEPTISVLEPAPNVMVAEDAKLAFEFVANDDYGVRSVTLLRVSSVEERRNDNEPERELRVFAPEGKFAKEFRRRFELPVSELGIEAGKTGTVVLRAVDWNDVTKPGRAEVQLRIGVASAQQARAEEERKVKAAAKRLSDVIRLQERNLRDSKNLQRAGVPEGGFSADNAVLVKLITTQEEVRVLTREVIETLRLDHPIRGTLESLLSAEMVVAVRQLRDVPKDAGQLPAAIETESDILARLTARRQSLADSINRKNMQDIFAELDAIIAEEKGIRSATQGQIEGRAWNNKMLAEKQDGLSVRLGKFKARLTAHADEIAKSDVEQAERFKEIAESIDTMHIYQDMIRAAAAIDGNKAEAALTIEDRIIANLESIKKELRRQVAEEAEEKLAKLKKSVMKSAEKTEKLIKLEKKIRQVSEELEAARDLSEDDNEDLKRKVEELTELNEKMEEVIEKMAKDLQLFPEIPACNELVQKMREVYEDVDQAPGSESAPAEEVAVNRGDDKGVKPLADALKDMKERMADMEMWLLNAPNNIKWKQESLDRDEIPDIPMVDLPEEFEDLVGDLLDQEEQIAEEAQDSASNMGTADMPAGWGVDDGPMPNFSAKGKSGNTKPNSNEQTGRSATGREGPSDGEMVGQVAKDLEGRKTEARRTNDPAQKGEIAEENPNAEARATGGGKQSGQGGEGGLTGSAPPRNELGMRRLQRKQMELRRNTQKLYSKALLLYLPTGELDNAILLMQKAEEALARGDMTGFTSLQRRIVRSLDNTKRRLNGESTVAVDPWLKVPSDMKEEIMGARDEEIPAEYESLVSEYYKAIAGALAQ